MGSFGLFFEATLRIVASTRFSTILCAVFLLTILSAQGGHSAICSVDQCSETYKKATRRLEVAQDKDPLVDNTKKRCRVLKKLHRCLHKLRRVCRGNLLYHSIEHINDRDQKKSNCSRKPTILPPSSLSPLSDSAGANTTALAMTTTRTEPTEGSMCSYAGTSKHRHCGMFGDPHLRTYSDVFNTCKVEGTWPLIDNDYMVVMATNVPVKEGSSATVTTKITVLIKAAGQCAGQRHYVATSGRLPGAFSDGSSAVGSVEVVEAEPGKRVEIRAGFIGTTVIIRQVARYLTFAIRIPEEFITGMSSRTQLCVQGCPVNHQIAQGEADTFADATENQNNAPKDVAPAVTPPVTPDAKNTYGKDLQAKLTDSSGTEVPQYFTEKEARVKCRQILLDLPEPEPKKNSTKVTDNSKSGKTSKSYSTSLSSAAFSSLISSPTDELSPGRKHHRMAAARRPDSEVAHTSTKRKRGKERRSHRRRSRREIKLSDSETTKSSRCAAKKEKSRDSNFYFESCVFDLITTGDIDFTLAAKAAMDDVKRTHVMGGDAPGASLEIIRLWEPADITDCPESEGDGNPDNPGGKASSNTVHRLTLILCVLFSCIFINLSSFISFRFVTVTTTTRKESKLLRHHQNNNILRTNINTFVSS